MAFSKPLLLALVFSFVVLSLLDSHSAIAAASSEGPSPVPSPAPSPINCDGACSYRCSQSGRAKMCMKMCEACCHKCGCVPNGPEAPRESACACYANLKTPKRGTYKCP